MGRHNLSKQVAAGGITVLLTVLLLYLSYILPTGRLFFFSLSTVFISLMVIEYGGKAAFITYTATAFLGFIIIPDKLILVPYIIFFGYYGIIKSFIEKNSTLIIEWVIKYLLYNIALFVFYSLYIGLLNLPFNGFLPLSVLVFILELYFFVYDYCYTLAISYYMKVLRDIVIK